MSSTIRVSSSQIASATAKACSATFGEVPIADRGNAWDASEPWAWCRPSASINMNPGIRSVQRKFNETARRSSAIAPSPQRPSGPGSDQTRPHARPQRRDATPRSTPLRCHPMAQAHTPKRDGSCVRNTDNAQTCGRRGARSQVRMAYGAQSSEVTDVDPCSRPTLKRSGKRIR